MKRLCTAVGLVLVTLMPAGCSGSGPGAAEQIRPKATPFPAMSATSSHRALAAAEVAHVLATIPLPPGARLSGSRHHGARLDHLGCQCGAVDPSLTRTRWYTVPMSYGELVRWYGVHSPANLGSAHYADGSVSPHGDLTWPVQVSSTAYSPPVAVVSYVRRGPFRTAIRTDAMLAARYDRTTSMFAPSDVTRIDITKTALGGEATPTTATVTDRARIDRVTAAFNDLSGAFAHTLPVGCGSPTSDQYVYAVTFHWPGHVLAVDPGAALCGVGMGLTLDGVKLPRTLEGSPGLDAALEAAL
jgi:hypothetical protein